MSYEKAIEATGAEVHCVQYFGSYQGDIWAKVTYQGRAGWIAIGYGSCSVCDPYEAWESDFGWDIDPTEEQLADFGRGYVESLMTQEEAERRLEEYAEWDGDSSEALAFVKANAI